MKPAKKIFNTIIAAYLGTALCGGILLGVVLYSIESNHRIRGLSQFRPNLPSKVYDIHGKLISELFFHKRELVSLDDIPQHLVLAFIAVEDTSFFEHFGIDFGGILRALWANIKAFRIVQGGSTITQQLVKRLYTKSEKTLLRKIYEAVLSLQIEKHFSKDEILEMYLNQIYLGHGSYGISSASQFYFEKNIEDINIVESAIMASLPKSPNQYSPFKNPNISYQKSKIALSKIAKLTKISKEELYILHAKFWKQYIKKVMLVPSTKNSFGIRKNRAPYFMEYVRQILENRISKEDLYSKGLNIYTTLDLDMQLIAENLMQEAVHKADPVAKSANILSKNMSNESLMRTYQMIGQILPLATIQKKHSLKNEFLNILKSKKAPFIELLSLYLPKNAIYENTSTYLKDNISIQNLQVQCALLVMHPNNGRIFSMIGGREFKASDQFNRAISARRQPGSAFKPFVYGAALQERKIHPYKSFVDSPIYNVAEDGSVWMPNNYEGDYDGSVSVTRALSMSMNLISIQVYDLIGPEPLIKFASKLTKLPLSRFSPNPSLALGASELTPMELLQGFAVIANQGKDVIPHPVIYVTDTEGYTLHNFEEEIYKQLSIRQQNNELQLMEEEIAFILRKMMQKVTSGTAHQGIRVQGRFEGDVAGKTGTTSSWHDAWFGGFTSDLIAVVWMGLDRGNMSLGIHQSGGTLAAPIWGKLMYQVYKQRKGLPKPFSKQPPKNVIVRQVTRSGKLNNPACPQPMVTTYIPSPIIDPETQESHQINLKMSECNEIKTKSILDIMQEQNSISNEEIGKTKKHFKKPFNIE